MPRSDVIISMCFNSSKSDISKALQDPEQESHQSFPDMSKREYRESHTAVSYFQVRVFAVHQILEIGTNGRVVVHESDYIGLVHVQFPSILPLSFSLQEANFPSIKFLSGAFAST